MICTEREQAERFTKFLHRNGREWVTGRSYALCTHMDSDDCIMRYYFNRGTYTSYRHGFSASVLDEYTLWASDFIFEEDDIDIQPDDDLFMNFLGTYKLQYNKARETL